MLFDMGAASAAKDPTLTVSGIGGFWMWNYFPEKDHFQIELCHMGRPQNRRKTR